MTKTKFNLSWQFVTIIAALFVDVQIDQQRS